MSERTGGQTAIDIRNLTKVYPDGTVAVDDVSFSIADGDFCVLIGPSGCGKSTTLHTLAGIIDLTDGEIAIYDEDISDTPSYDRDVGLVFQDFQLFPHMTVDENIRYGIERDSNTGEREQSVSDIVDLMQLGSLLDSYPAELSAGQRQRVALARSVALNPAVLLFDEPLGDLDYKLQRVMEREIMRLHHEVDTTIVYVTHDQTQAMRLADQIVVMNDGQIEQSGTVEEVYYHPTTAFVAAFVGDSNIFNGDVVGTDAAADTVEVETAYGRFTVDSDNYDGDDVADLTSERVAFAVRPQHLRVVNEAATNRLECDVLDVIERVKGGTKAFLEAKLPEAGAMEVQLNASDDLVTGDEDKVTVGWGPEDAILLTETSVVPGIDLEKDILGQ